MKIKHLNVWLILTVVVVTGYMAMLLYRIADTPTLFIDEANYANEIISFINFGTDIHGYKLPVYFSSVWGQGQSVLYALLMLPIIKLFGFSFLLFRSGMVILLGIMMALVSCAAKSNENYRYAFLAMLGLAVSPWVFMSNRWVLDANVAPLILLIGLMVYLLALRNQHPVIKVALLTFSAAMIALTAYGYVASWIYLPILLLALLIFSLKRRLVTVKELLIPFLVLVIMLIPIMVFAFNTNVLHGTNSMKLFGLDIPVLVANRTESLVWSNGGNVAVAIVKNVGNGLIGYVTGTDSYAWNAVKPFGVIMPWLLPFSVVGLFWPLRNYSKNLFIFREILRIAVLSFLPVMLVVTFNFNHWNFLNLPLAILSGIGLMVVIDIVKNKVAQLGLVGVAVVGMLSFMPAYYQQYQADSSTGEPIRYRLAIDLHEIDAIDKFMATQPESKLYIVNMERTFQYWRLNWEPINRQRYLSISDIQGNANSEKMWPRKSFGYLRDYKIGQTELKKNEFALIDAKTYKKFGNQFRVEKKVNFMAADHYIVNSES